MDQFFFRVDASKEIGLGHLVRCLTIAEYLKKMGYNAVFITKTPGLKEFIASKRRTNFDVEVLLTPDVEKELDIIQMKTQKLVRKCIFIDINNYFTFKNKEEYIDYLIGLKNLGMFILSFEDFKIHPDISDVVIIPYIGAERIKTPKNGSKYLLGPQYYVMDKQFSEVLKESMSDQVHNILISMGGSDPKGATLQILNSFNSSEIRSHLIIVLGALCSIREEKIVSSLKDYQGTYSVLRSVNNMAQIMANSDLAIISSGLTKYEAASVGVPAIVVSFNEYHLKLMEEFCTYGTALNAGLAENGIGERILNLVNQLCQNTHQRKQMAMAGRSMIDFKGIERIWETIPL